MTGQQIKDEYGYYPCELLQVLEDIDRAAVFFVEHGLSLSIDMLQALKYYFVSLDTVQGYIDAKYLFDLQRELNKRMTEMLEEA